MSSFALVLGPGLDRDGRGQEGSECLGSLEQVL